MNYLDYDQYFDTKISRTYGIKKFGLITGVVLFLIGISEIVVSVVDLLKTNFNQDGAQQNKASVYTWDENPFWPTYGKGLWVGIFVVATGILGILSAFEHTITSIYGYIILSSASSILSFYLLITASIPVSKYAGESNNLESYYKTSLILNCFLMFLGADGFIFGAFTSLFSSYYAGLFTERRGYGGVFIHKYYKSLPANRLL